MDVQARAASIAALSQAPRLVVQIIEDVLAQTVAAQGGLGRPRAALAWERDLGRRLPRGDRRRLSLRPPAPTPTSPPSPTCSPRTAASSRFFATQLAPLMDTAETPWRWKPEARLSGFTAGERRLLRARRGGRRRALPARGRDPDPERAGAAWRGDGQPRRRGGAGDDLGRAAAALAWPGPHPDAGLADRLRHRRPATSARPGPGLGGSCASSTGCGCGPATAASASCST